MGTSRWRPPLDQRRSPRIIAVGGASPGGGKTVVAANLAVAIAGLGPHVVLVDFDFAAPRLHDLFGVTRPAPLPAKPGRERTTAALDSSLVGTGIRNLLLVPAPKPGLLAQEDKADLIRQLHDLAGDVVVVDVGGANRDDLFDFFSTGALRLLVSGPDPRSLEATFAFLRAAARRAAELYGSRAPEALERFKGRLIGNHISMPEDVESFHAFARLVREHLGIPLPLLGCLRDSDQIPLSVAARRPLVARRGLDENVRLFHGMAELVMMDEVVSRESDGPDEACDLSSAEPLVVEGAALPADLKRYRRRHPRYAVDWAARLELASGATEVRVLDVSYAGAGVEVFTELAVGDQAILRLDQLPGQPALRVVVKNILAGLHRVGVSFLEPGETSARLEAAAAALTESGKLPV